jgi:hypothetical protein
MVNCFINSATLLFVGPAFSNDYLGPPVPMPRTTAASSQIRMTAGWSIDGVIFSPPVPDLERASMPRRQASSISAASSRVADVRICR